MEAVSFGPSTVLSRDPRNIRLEVCTETRANVHRVHFCALETGGSCALLCPETGVRPRQWEGIGTPGKFEVKLKALWWQSKGKEAIIVLCAVGGIYNRSCV